MNNVTPIYGNHFVSSETNGFTIFTNQNVTVQIKILDKKERKSLVRICKCLCAQMW